jgi:hypothetical protein
MGIILGIIDLDAKENDFYKNREFNFREIYSLDNTSATK